MKINRDRKILFDMFIYRGSRKNMRFPFGEPSFRIFQDIGRFKFTKYNGNFYEIEI